MRYIYLLFIILGNSILLAQQPIKCKSCNDIGKVYEKECCGGRIIVPTRDSLIEKKHYEKSLSMLLQMQGATKRLELSRLYNIAVNYSMLGNVDSAFNYLFKYVDSSRDDRVIIVDNRFDTLKQFKRWDSLIEKIEYYYIRDLKPDINKDLALELFYLGIEDQKYRVYIPTLDFSQFPHITHDTSADGTITISARTEITDDDINALAAIIKKYGFPSISMVGMLGSTNAFLVLQHSFKIKKYYKLVRMLHEKGDFDSYNFALLTDRLLGDTYKEQIYGSQLCDYYKCHGRKIDKKYPGKFILCPVKDFKNINERRKQLGMDETVEEYVKGFNDTNFIIPIEYYDK